MIQSRYAMVSGIALAGIVSGIAASVIGYEYASDPHVTETRGGTVETPMVATRAPSATSTPTLTPTATSTATGTPTPIPATSTPTPIPIPVVPTETPTPVPQYVAPSTPADVAGESVSAITPVPVPVAPAESGGYTGQCGGGLTPAVTRWWDEVRKYPWDACYALVIIQRESGGDPDVYNFEGSTACGLLQLLPCQYPGNGPANIAAGYEKYVAAGGWSPWAASGG